MQWFKFYGQDWLTDIKIVRMTAVDKLLFITLLCLADQDGRVKDCDEETIKQLTHLYDNPYETDNDWTRATGFIQRFYDNGMITLDTNGDVIIRNWVKRQSKNLTGYERVKRWREKQKQANTPLNEGEVNDNNDNADTARIEENRIDKNIHTSGAEPPRIVPSKESEEEERPKRKPKYPHSKEVFSWFPSPQRNWEINTTELRHAELLWERGEDKVRKNLKYVLAHQDEDYFPKVNKPSDLERKWNDIAYEYGRRK